MLVLEGVDGGGKTTLANRLSEELGWKVWHAGAPTKPYLEEWLHPLVAHPDNDLILDRWHLGDLVYGPTWRGKTMNLQEFVSIEMALQVRGATLVHVYGNPERIAEQLRIRGDDLVAPEDIQGHTELYRKVIPRSLLPTVSWSHERLEGVPMGEILYRHRRADDYRAAFPSMPGIGNLNPSWVFVGERPNQLKVLESKSVPFAVGASGDWLFEALEQLELLGHVYLTNAIKADGDRDLSAQEFRWLQGRSNKLARGNSPVVALGLQASAVLERHKIPHRLAQHPSYARRFHYSSSYADHLSGVMS